MVFEGLLTLWFCPAPEGWIWFTSLWCSCPDPLRISAHLQNTQSSSTEQRRTKRTEEVQEVLRAQPNIWNPFSTWEVNCLDSNFSHIQLYCNFALKLCIFPFNIKSLIFKNNFVLGNISDSQGLLFRMMIHMLQRLLNTRPKWVLHYAPIVWFSTPITDPIVPSEKLLSSEDIDFCVTNRGG